MKLEAGRKWKEKNSAISSHQDDAEIITTNTQQKAMNTDQMCVLSARALTQKEEKNKKATNETENQIDVSR